MRAWDFRCYRSARGVDEVRLWHDQQSRGAQAKFLSRLKTLRQWQGHEWRPPFFRWLSGEFDGLGEIRFGFSGVEYRPLGFKRESIFYIVIGAREKNDQFDPRNAPLIALNRKKEIEADHERAIACWLHLD